MPNPTTIHDAAQNVLREIERERNMELLDVEQFRFIPSKTKWQVDIYFIERGYGENFCDSCLDESDATKLVAMILETFPMIREQIKKSKP